MPNLLDELWMKVRVYTGTCASNVQLGQVKDYLEKGEQYARHAALAGTFTHVNGDAVAKLRRGADALNGVHSRIDSLQNVCMDVQAVAKITDALRILNNPENIKPGSQIAAKAFGDLFVGAGRFASKLPPPVNAYGMLLENSGDFFVNMQRLLDPERRPNGRQLREVMAGFDRGEY